MTSSTSVEATWIERVRAGDPIAWRSLIEHFEGRLLAYLEVRCHDRATCEDLVQETFIGFLTSLPNYDVRRPLESYLFSIAAHKLTDHLRRQGRRPTLPLSGGGDDSRESWEPADSARSISGLARSGERRDREGRALAEGLASLVDHWRRRGDWGRLSCLELLIVRGSPNKEVARRLGISEQQVANYKSDFISRLRDTLRRQGISADLFPELAPPADGESSGRV